MCPLWGKKTDRRWVAGLYSRRHWEDRKLSSRCHQHALILLAYASICTPASWAVILPLIASVFYHDALLSPTRSLGSCQRSPLTASHRDTGQFLQTERTNLLCWTAERARESQRDVAVGFLLMQMKSWDSVLSIISGAGHTVHHHLVPLLWAAPVLGHYLHQFSCCNQQMEQPQWKPFLSISEKRGSEVKGRQGEKGIEIRTWGGERKCGNCARKGDSVQHIKTEAQGQPGRGECMRRYPNQDGIIIFFPFCTVVLEQHCTKTEVNKS